MRAPLDIVGREFTKNRPQVLLVEHDNVVQALSVSRLRVPRLRFARGDRNGVAIASMPMRRAH